MVSSEILKRIIVENAEFAQGVSLIARPLDIEENGNYVFIGPRRSGKSFTMLRIMQDIMRGGGTPADFLYIRFEDERLLEFRADGFDMLLDSHGELYGVEKPTVFFDEIQEAPGWEKFVRRLADNKYRIFVTGSNAKMIGRELATTLGGRFFVTEIFPYSFSEYLAANGVSVQKKERYGRDRITVARLFDEWFHWGGFPELSSFQNKRIWLENLYQKIFYGDIMARYAIRNGAALRLLVKKLAESVGTDISINRMKNIITSIGVKIGKTTIIDYIGFLKDSFMILIAENWLKGLSEREQEKKYYFVDNGLLSLFVSNENAKLLENIVAIELARCGYPLYFAKDKDEIDFYIESEGIAIQVCYSLMDPEICRREIDSIRKINRKLGAKRFLIITMEEDRTIESDGMTIEIISIKNTWGQFLNPHANSSVF